MMERGGGERRVCWEGGEEWCAGRRATGALVLGRVLLLLGLDRVEEADGDVQAVVLGPVERRVLLGEQVERDDVGDYREGGEREQVSGGR